MKKDRLWSLFLIATVIFMIVCGCRLIQIVLRYQEADRLYDDIEKKCLSLIFRLRMVKSEG